MPPPIVTADPPDRPVISDHFQCPRLQAITASSKATPPSQSDYIPVFQYALFSLLFHASATSFWQDFLESTFPAYHLAPTTAAVSAASDPDAKLDAAKGGPKALVEPRLNKRNTAAKTLLDQTVGAAANTAMYSLFMHAARQAMAHHYAARAAAAGGGWGGGGGGVGVFCWGAAGRRC